MRTDGEISKVEYKEQRKKIDKVLAELNEEYERMLAAGVDVFSKLWFPRGFAFVSVPFIVFFTTLFAGNNDGEIVFFAQFITQLPDVVVGLFAVMVLVMLDVVRSTKCDVVVDMTFIYMGGNYIVQIMGGNYIVQIIDFCALLCYT